MLVDELVPQIIHHKESVFHASCPLKATPSVTVCHHTMN